MMPLERFSIECNKSKTKVVTRPITTDDNNTRDQSDVKAITGNRRREREYSCYQVTIVLVWHLIG